MKKEILLIFSLLLSINISAQWKPQGEEMKTVWGEALNPDAVWQEYPRPIMERGDWKNLNGLWITPSSLKEKPSLPLLTVKYWFLSV